ncbi:MAG: alpha/beta fold hydrolase [Nitrospiraceae bacterium]
MARSEAAPSRPTEVRQFSTKTRLLLLPGFLCNDRLWAHQIAHAPDHADLTVPDLTGRDSIQDMAIAVLNDAPDSFALGGFSMGGIVAQEIMRLAPQRVTKLALISTSARQLLLSMREQYVRALDHIEKGRFRHVIAEAYPLYVHPSRIKDDALKQAMLEMMASVGPEVAVRQIQALLAYSDYRPYLGAIACPTLVLCGREDTRTPIDRHMELAQGIPQSQLVVIEGSGHFVPLERPEEVSLALRDWLSN